MIPKSDMILMQYGKYLFACSVLLLLAGMAHAHEVCWQNPTENTDGTPITDLQLVRVQWGTVAAGVVYSDGRVSF